MLSKAEMQDAAIEYDYDRKTKTMRVRSEKGEWSFTPGAMVDFGRTSFVTYLISDVLSGGMILISSGTSQEHFYSYGQLFSCKSGSMFAWALHTSGQMRVVP